MSHGFAIIHHSAAHVIKLTMFSSCHLSETKHEFCWKNFNKALWRRKGDFKTALMDNRWVHLLHGEESNVLQSPHRSLDFLWSVSKPIVGTSKKFATKITQKSTRWNLSDKTLLRLRLAKLVGLADTALRQVSLWVKTIGSSRCKREMPFESQKFFV